jgi:hypothetical protein
MPEHTGFYTNLINRQASTHHLSNGPESFAWQFSTCGCLLWGGIEHCLVRILTSSVKQRQNCNALLTLNAPQWLSIRHRIISLSY